VEDHSLMKGNKHIDEALIHEEQQTHWWVPFTHEKKQTHWGGPFTHEEPQTHWWLFIPEVPNDVTIIVSLSYPDKLKVFVIIYLIKYC
jgi:hypothetical protein